MAVIYALHDMSSRLLYIYLFNLFPVQFLFLFNFVQCLIKGLSTPIPDDDDDEQITRYNMHC